jgi:hypothetical protein
MMIETLNRRLYPVFSRKIIKVKFFMRTLQNFGGTKEMKCLYRGLKPRLKSTFASLMIFALLFSFLGAVSPATAAAATPADSLIVNIDNNGETTTVHTYTLAEMEALSGEDSSLLFIDRLHAGPRFHYCPGGYPEQLGARPQRKT